ncbi:MAG: hypothetical protein IJD92_00715 [Bacilli bacterium]|nr:hypothetical protein [Bacilli bacterium]
MIIEILGLVFCIIVGTIGHFLYEWSNYNNIVGFFFSKNENVWEHMKLGITPIIMWTIIELLTFNFNNLFFAKFSSIVTFSVSLMVLYYSYKKVIKKNILFLDILIFYISITLSSYVSIKLLMLPGITFINFLSFIGMLFIIYLYFKFNKNTPNWFIFKNPN